MVVSKEKNMNSINNWPTKIKKLLAVVCVAIIFAFVFIFSVGFFGNLFLGDSDKNFETLIGGFAGAFFAFLFLRIGEALTKIYERQNKHYNALVTLERLCNRYLNVISNNIFVINDFTTLAKKALEENKPFIYFNVLHEFSLDEEITLNLSNLDLINDVFSFEMGIDKMNNSISATNRFYSEIKSAFVQKTIDFETYKINVGILVSKLSELKAFLDDLERENKEIVARARILMKDKPIFTLLVHMFSKKRYPSDIKDKTLQEIKKLDKEIEQVRTASQASIDNVLQKNNFKID